MKITFKMLLYLNTVLGDQDYPNNVRAVRGAKAVGAFSLPVPPRMGEQIQLVTQDGREALWRVVGIRHTIASEYTVEVELDTRKTFKEDEFEQSVEHLRACGFNVEVQDLDE